MNLVKELMVLLVDTTETFGEYVALINCAQCETLLRRIPT